MTFLNPLLLLALASVAVPVLLHFLNLRRPRPVDFSSLEFLQTLQESAVQRVRIKEWLLLALRILAVAALVMAFARPTLTGALAGAVGQRARTALAVVVDNSLSMTVRDGQGAYLDQVARQAQGVLDTAEPGDDLLVWPTALEGAAEPAPYQTVGPARDAVRALASRPGAEPLARTILRAARTLAADTDAPAREVFVLGDLQTSTLADSLPEPVPEGVRVTLLPVGTRTPPNVGLTGVRVASRIVEVGQPVEIEATLTNYGSEPLEDYVASAYLEGDRVAQATATLPPAEATTVTFTATPQARGWLAGTVELEDDAFAPDDVEHFTLHVPEERRLLVVRGEGQVTRYVDLALSREMVEGRLAFRTDTITEDDLAATTLGRYDAVVLVGPATLSTGEVRAVSRYVEDGGGVLFFPSPRARADDYNALLDALGGGRFSGFSGDLGSGRAVAQFERVDLEHPLFEGVFDPRARSGSGQPTVESPSIFFTMNLAGGSGRGQTLVELSSGLPFLQEVRHGRGVALFMAVAPNPQWSDFPVRGLFIPLLYRSMFYLSAGETGGDASLVAGQTRELRLTGVAGGSGAPVRLVGPDGTEVVPEQRTVFGATLLEAGAALRTPGVYDVLAGDALVRRVAVNLDPRESALARTEPAEAAAALSEALGAEVRLLDAAGADAPAVADALREQRAGTEIWNAFLLLALGLLVTEMLLASQWKPETVAA